MVTHVLWVQLQFNSLQNLRSCSYVDYKSQPSTCATGYDVKGLAICERGIYTGRFIMFSVITNIYNKKTKVPTLMEFFTGTGKLKKFYHGWHGTHRYNIQVLATHASTWVHRYSSLLQWSVPQTRIIVSMCAVSSVVHTSNISSCQKKSFFSFLVAVNNSIKVSPLVFLL
jgi:hypothetical protein